MMGEICDQLGYPHEQAVTGKNCLSMMQAKPHRADILLMDIHMPELSGVEACAWLRDFYRDCDHRPIILALTADEFWQSPENSAAAGFDGVICKPISIKGVALALQNAKRDEVGQTG